MDEQHMIDLALCREVAETCASIRLRKAARAVNRFYDQARESSGLTGAQFSLLVVTALAGEPAMGDLATLLELDQTTLSRNLNPLKKSGLVTVLPGADRRVRHVRLTLEGRARLNQALLLWKQAQQQFVGGMGEAAWETLAAGLQAARRTVGK